MFCEKCGQQIPDESTFCPFCNNVVSTPNPQQNAYYAPAQDNNYYNQQQPNAYAQPQNDYTQPQSEPEQYFNPQGNVYQNNPYSNYQPNMPFIDPNVTSQISNCKTLGLVAIIVGIFVPIVGWVCGGIGLSNAKNIPDLPQYANEKKKVKNMNLAGIIVPFASYLLAIIFYVLIFTLMATGFSALY